MDSNTVPGALQSRSRKGGAAASNPSAKRKLDATCQATGSGQYGLEG